MRPAGDLILAELCSPCAAKAFGWQGSPTAPADTLRLVHDVRPAAPAHNVAGFIARGVLYILFALTFFLIVTLISSSAH